MIGLDEVRAALHGPVPSISTPFLADGEINYPGLRNQIHFMLDHGAKTIFLTPGDSHYYCLSDREITELAGFVIREAKNKAMTVISDFRYSTGRAIEFASFVRDAGGDLYLPYPPDWAASMTSETLADHYATIGKIMPLLLIFTPLAGGAGPGMKNLELTFAKTDRVLAIKDDICGEAGRKLSIHFHPRCAVISGGQKQNHLNAYPYGLDGYFSTFSKLVPSIAHEYFHRIENNQILEAAQIIKDYDMPFFNHIIALPGGFDAGIHAMLEICGICPRHRRAPYYTLNDQEMEALRDFMTKIKIIS